MSLHPFDNPPAQPPAFAAYASTHSGFATAAGRATGKHIAYAARRFSEGGSRGATGKSHQVRCEYHVGVVEQGW